MRYRNPSAIIDIQMAEPTGQPGASSSAFSRMTNFYISTPVPPKDYYWAPKIALSSTWQVRGCSRMDVFCSGDGCS